MWKGRVILLLLLLLLLTCCLLGGIGKEAEDEYRALLDLDQRIDSLRSRAARVPRLSSFVDLSLLHHLREERFKQGDCWKSIAYADLALDQQPSPLLASALALHKARLLIDLGEFDAAVAVLNDLIARLEQEDSLAGKKASLLAAAVFTIGRAKVSAGRLVEARPFLRHALRHSPCLHQAHYQLALTFSRVQSRPDVEVDNVTAEGVAEEVEAVLPLVQLRESEVVLLDEKGEHSLCAFDADEDFYMELLGSSEEVREGVAVIASQPEERLGIVRSALYWALFTLYDGPLDHPGKAWEYLLLAREEDRHRLQSPSAVRAVQEAIAASDHVRAFFGPGYWPLREEDQVGSPSEVPVFIVGYFRSGSSLTEHLLAVHEEVLPLGEQSPFTLAMHPLQRDLLLAVEGRYQESAATTPEVEEEEEVEEEGWTTLKRLSAPLKFHGERIVQQMREMLLPHLHYFNITRVQANTRYSITQARSFSSPAQNQRIVDKMLLNYRNIALIHLVFPRALIIHTVRDPLDTMLSCLKHRFGEVVACSMGVDLAVQDYAAYLSTMDHFRRTLPRISYRVRDPTTSSGYRVIRRSALVDVRYEELVARPEAVMRRVFALLGLQFPGNDSLHAFHASSRAVRTASFLQVQQPLYTHSVGGWRKYAQGVQDAIVPRLAPLVKELAARDALPFKKSKVPMNWQLDSAFNYTAYLLALR
eukprot:gene9302-10268_t